MASASTLPAHDAPPASAPTTHAERMGQRRALREAAFAKAGVRPIPYGRRVTCPLCGAKPRQKCRTRFGRVLTDIHQRRFDRSRQAECQRLSKLVLLVDDPRFGLEAGDILIGHPYAYDAKWTILRRERDGYDPECNQYSSDVAWIGWAD